MSNRADWERIEYARRFPAALSPSECAALISAASQGDRVHSKIGSDRDSEIFWLSRSEGLAWAFERLEAIARDWNRDYQYDISAGIDRLQLTHYQPGQFYKTHVDLGAGPASRRRISVVCQLNHPSEYRGGGLTIIYDWDRPWRTQLNLGDAVAFHSWVQHRAEPVAKGERWSLVAWLNGSEPLR